MGGCELCQVGPATSCPAASCQLLPHPHLELPARVRDNQEPELSLASLAFVASSEGSLRTVALGLRPWLTNLSLSPLPTKRAKKQELLPAPGRLKQEEYNESEASLATDDGVWGHLE